MSHATSPVPISEPRRVVVAAGLHGSASTWVFNVVRELMEAQYSAARVTALYAESPAEATGHAGTAKCMVWKTHWGGPGFFEFLAASGADLLVSIRDPRDALLSIAERFREPADDLVPAIAEDCTFALACARAGASVLRYEARFFDRLESVTEIGDRLGVAAPASLCRRIFADWRTEAVRAHAARLPDLPDGRWLDQGTAGGVDLLTQVHLGHIGDAASGKWRERLHGPVARALGAQVSDFLAHFGYPAA